MGVQPLKVVWEGDQDERRGVAGLTPNVRLSEFFWFYAWPDVLEPKGDSSRTLKDYLTTLQRWRQLTGDPPIRKITERTLSKFLRLLAGLTESNGYPSMRNNTVRKHGVIIDRLIRYTGPRTRDNPTGADLLEKPPWIPLPRLEGVAPKRPLRLEEIGAWLHVLPEEAQPLPKMCGADPVAWWRALILLAYNTGWRPQTLFDFRWDWLDGQRVTVPVAGIKGRRGRIFWLNQSAMAAIEPLREYEGGLVLNWWNHKSGNTALRRHRERMQRVAGIPAMPLYALRRSFATQLAAINPLAAQIAMGHEGLGMAMMINHYLEPEAILAEALYRLPQPVEKPLPSLVHSFNCPECGKFVTRGKSSSLCEDCQHARHLAIRRKNDAAYRDRKRRPHLFECADCGKTVTRRPNAIRCKDCQEVHVRARKRQQSRARYRKRVNGSAE